MGMLVPYRSTGEPHAINGNSSTEAITDFIAGCLDTPSRGGNGGSGGREEPSALKRAVTDAAAGEQRTALLRYVHELERRGYDRADIVTLLKELLTGVSNFDSRNPWYPARGGNPERHINLLFHRRGAVKPDVTDPEEAALLASIKGPQRADDENDFWNANPVLVHIRGWARARRAGPWATLGEALAEAICHTAPSLQLPPAVGSNGTLNMLIALAGASGAGKNAARQTARCAFHWHGSAPGVIEGIPDTIPRIPLGSGEGLVKNYGYNVKGKDTGRAELVRSEYSTIVTIPEIDTFAAINNRSGATISPELRKFYSGEDIGFGWSDPTKRIIIPEHSYRGCVIAGVQPGRGEAILADTDGGFAQRWLWLPVIDPLAPDERPGDPPVREWCAPAPIAELEPDEVLVMTICARAKDATDMNRLTSLRGTAEEIESQSAYTRLKVAAGLALLFGHDAVGDAEWDLSGYVMKVSNRTRDAVSALLADKRRKAVLAAGRDDGLRSDAAAATAARAATARVCRNILAKMPPRSAGWISTSELRRNIAMRDRDDLAVALDELVDKGRIEAGETTYHGQTGMKYRKAAR